MPSGTRRRQKDFSVWGMAEDWQFRTRMLIGDRGIERLASARVVVAGAGGVGGYAAEMLVRAGVGHMLVIDSDTVADSNRNRQILALRSTVGKAKCEVLAQRLLDINQDLDLVTLQEYITPSYKSDGSPVEDPGPSSPVFLLGGRQIDFVVDAIDTVAPKLSLIKYCMDNHIPVVSSMGAGAKSDVTKIRITDISKSYNCPLAHVVRKRMRRMGVPKGFKVVFSEELADTDAIVPCDELNKKSQVGSISYIPAVFGCACAQAVVEGLLAGCRD